MTTSCELHNRQSWHEPEVANVGGGHTVTELQRGDADQQVGKRKSVSSGLILSVDLPRAKSQGRRDRMDGSCCQQFLDELLPLRLSLRRVGTSRPVGQFDQRHH